jgi:hypothetical protein
MDRTNVAQPAEQWVGFLIFIPRVHGWSENNYKEDHLSRPSVIGPRPDPGNPRIHAWMLIRSPYKFADAC